MIFSTFTSTNVLVTINSESKVGCANSPSLLGWSHGEMAYSKETSEAFETMMTFKGIISSNRFVDAAKGGGRSNVSFHLPVIISFLPNYYVILGNSGDCP